MKTLLHIFLPIVGIGSVLKLLLLALKKEEAIKILETILGMSLLIAMIPKTEFTLPKINRHNVTDEAYFLSIQEEQLEEILNIAETEMEPILKKEVEELTGVAPLKCSVDIEKEFFSIQEIHFCFSQNVFLSTYDIIRHFKEKYNAEVTVTME